MKVKRNIGLSALKWFKSCIQQQTDSANQEKKIKKKADLISLFLSL